MSKRHSGFSLVELLIAMTLGLILTAGMIAVFSGNKRSSDMNSAMANIQENARFALSSMARDIRMAGYQGCVDMEKGGFDNNVAASLPLPVSPQGIRFSASTGAVVTTPSLWTPAAPSFPAGANIFTPPVVNPAITGTHALILQFGSSNESRLAQPMTFAGNNFAGDVITQTNLGFNDGDLAIVGDCNTTDVFRISEATLHAGGGQVLKHSATHNNSGNLKRVFGDGEPATDSGARVMRLMANIYYVGDTGLRNEDGDSITALYMQSLPYNTAGNPPAELVQGVENMRVAFGIRTPAGLRYVAADNAAFDPTQVESIQLGLLMSSWDRIAEVDDSNTYMLAGQPIGPSTASVDATTHPQDKRYRLVFNTTIKVRNRRPALGS